MEYHLTLPLTEEERSRLRAGDLVYLSGTVYTARDAGHARLTALLDEGKELPFPLRDAAVYYVGPTPEKPGEIIGSAGPTTSGRMDPYTPRLLDLGLQVIIGKGKRNRAVQEALIRNKALYFAALGGAGALIADCITAAETICWEDLGCEALRKLTIQELPLTLVLDAAGGNLYESGTAAYLAAERQG